MTTSTKTENDTTAGQSPALGLAHGSPRFYTIEPECPYCGHLVRDAWELNFGGMEGETTHECGHCEREFTVERSVSISYTTRPLANVADEQRRGKDSA